MRAGMCVVPNIRRLTTPMQRACFWADRRPAPIVVYSAAGVGSWLRDLELELDKLRDQEDGIASGVGWELREVKVRVRIRVIKVRLG
jgi:hypothetical protein